MTNSSSFKQARKPRRRARQPQPENNAGQEPAETTQPSRVSPTWDIKPQTKTALILGMLTRTEGVTLAQMVEATGWLPHTARAALTGFRKKGYAVTSEVVDGVRTYRLRQTADPE